MQITKTEIEVRESDLTRCAVVLADVRELTKVLPPLEAMGMLTASFVAADMSRDHLILLAAFGMCAAAGLFNESETTDAPETDETSFAL